MFTAEIHFGCLLCDLFSPFNLSTLTRKQESSDSCGDVLGFGRGMELFKCCISPPHSSIPVSPLLRVASTHSCFHQSVLLLPPHFSVCLDSYPLLSFHVKSLAFYKLCQLSNDEVTNFIAMYNFPFFPTMFFASY